MFTGRLFAGIPAKSCPARVIVPVVERFGLPVKFVGLGESADDLESFDPDAFVVALLEGTPFSFAAPYADHPSSSGRDNSASPLPRASCSLLAPRLQLTSFGCQRPLWRAIANL